ncbi:hypothetical protein WAI453_007914 [Rhynchosporium graminicola]|uniref:endo-1,4-beta-xylanase n=1 Tax=Rhynchosporium graminicola TaxID=2792576 RepID=A0A1E1KUQ5_9HELO|nr:related to Endo-1,4-beta-xylanase A [Rhynchosporium commune]
MVSFIHAIVGALVAAGALATPTKAYPAALGKRVYTNIRGENNGFFFSFWTIGEYGNVTYTNGTAGSYSTTWSDVDGFTTGKGWRVAKPRNITFSASVKAIAREWYISVYTSTPKGETYIMENHSEYNPCSAPLATAKGTLHSDGSDYEVCEVDRGADFLQNWSIRKDKRFNGTVTTANHYNYFAAQGMVHNPIEDADYQIFATESFLHGSGSANVTVSEAI